MEAKSIVNGAGIASPKEATAEAKPVLCQKKAKVDSNSTDVEAWSLAEYMRDAEYFADNFGLPDDGLNPFKITDITDQMLISCFGEKSKNGYKLSSCTGLPVDEMVELSQVLDGYDKPVNGVLSHSFMKGVYAERIQRRKVNWAAYASAKLKGQIAQWERERKGKPDGPPCIRKPRQYKPPASSEHDVDVKPLIREGRPLQVREKVEPSSALLLRDGTIDSSSLENNSPANLVANEPLNEDRLTTLLPVAEKEKEPVHLLLGILRSAMAKTASNVRVLSKQITLTRARLEELRKAEADQPRLRKYFEEEIGKAEAEFACLGKEMACKEADVDSLTTDIELEGNKEDSNEGPNEYFAVLESRLETNQRVLHDHHDRQVTVSKEIQTLKNLLTAKERTFEDLPKKEATTRSLLAGLESDLKAVHFRSNNQEKEHSILAAVLETSSPVLIPRFVPTSIHTVGTQISLTNCPICCNGFHCYNWIRASCGHTYHPACLFPLIATSWSDPKCHACGEGFSHDWLRGWGLEQGGSVSSFRQTKIYVDDMRNVYGKHSSRLGRRRELARQIQSVQEKDGDTECEFTRLNSAEGLSFEDTVEHGSSKHALLTPEADFSEPGKLKRKAEGSADAKKGGRTRGELCAYHPLSNKNSCKVGDFVVQVICSSGMHFVSMSERAYNELDDKIDGMRNAECGRAYNEIDDKAKPRL